jgi:hypothetical protein
VSKPKRLNLLFIGNSFTARNDLPGLIAMLAEAGGHRLSGVAMLRRLRRHATQ